MKCRRHVALPQPAKVRTPGIPDYYECKSSLFEGRLFTPMDSIVDFTEAFFTPCSELFMQVFTSAPWHDRWTAESVANKLREFLKTPNPTGLVYLHQEQVVGFLIGNGESWFDGMNFFLKEICVAPHFQGRGIGSKLIRRLEALLKPQGIRRINLITSRNGSSDRFYSKQDYSICEQMIFMSHQLNG